MENAWTRRAACSACLGLALFGMGCASPITEPVTVEADFGNSVRQMQQAQTYDPAAATNPAPEAPAHDGAKASEVMQMYRQDLPRPQDIAAPIQINVRD
jgi:hypothetical protein